MEVHKREAAMETKFGVLEILKIAERLEHNGRQFYTKMAKLFIEARCRNLCEDLANWRAGRELTLARQRKQLHEQKAGFMPNDDCNYFRTNPDVIADLSIFADKFYPPHTLTGHESMSEIVKDAVNKTREAVIFYRGLKDFARNQETRALINQFIEEEIRYICTLGFKE
jgi:rubrerythrin